MAFSFVSAHPARQVALLFLLFAGAVQAYAGPDVQAASERRLKAAYLVRFATFVDWPDAAFARADSPLLIGVAGDPALAAQAERTVAGRKVRGHRVEVRRVGPDGMPRGLHILFVAAPRAHAPLLDAARHRPVLTVCDALPAPGCVIGLAASGGRLRVRVDRMAAAAAQLRVSARLLAVAS